MTDTFSKYHPAVNFLFFTGAIGCGVLFQHPAYLAVGAVTGAIYYLLLRGAKGIRTILGLVPLFVFLTAINPLFNTSGSTVLFRLFGRPYTWQALLYGMAVGGMFVAMLLWFGCYNRVLTGDKFTSLFGNLIPALSLLLVMVFRMVPSFIRKARQIVAARRSIGKGVSAAAGVTEKAADGLTVLGALTAWALEGSIVTGDSMRARGYGCTRRSSFLCYRMTPADWLLTGVMLALLAAVIISACLGQTVAVYTPEFSAAPVSWGIAAYTAYLLIPSVLHIKEAIQWHISRSKI